MLTVTQIGCRQSRKSNLKDVQVTNQTIGPAENPAGQWLDRYRQIGEKPEMKRPNIITAKLKKSYVELAEYVKQLEREIKRLQTYNAKLQVKDISQQAKISALEKGQPKVNISIDLGDKDKNE